MLPIATTIASTVLVAAFAARHFASARWGAVAAALFATMPVVWMAVRGGATQVVLLPFILATLCFFDLFYRGEKWTWLLLAGGAAAMMLYVHLAGFVMAPVYLAVGALVLLPRRDRIVAIGALAGGFALVASPWAIRWLRDPGLLREAINAYGLYDADRFNLLQGMREMTSWTGLTVRSEMYWDSFNPAVLFLGTGNFAHSLIGSKVFLLPFALPLALGLAGYVLHPRGPIDKLVLWSFVAAPLAAALIAQPTPPRLILLAPAAAIIATRGCFPVLARLAPLLRRPRRQ
jgi:4-amino-4-deoxy-L-arabinose transferase-like glycosyltransferase